MNSFRDLENLTTLHIYYLAYNFTALEYVLTTFQWRMLRPKTGLSHPGLKQVEYFEILEVYNVIQNGREVSAIIVTGNCLCYKEPERPYNFFFLLF